MTAKEILNFIRSVTNAPDNQDKPSQLVKDLNLIEQELPNELDNIYTQFQEGQWSRGAQNILHCSAEIRARKHKT